jgi:hypothetical protein
VLGIRFLTSLKKAAILELNSRKMYKTTTPDLSILVHFNHKRKNKNNENRHCHDEA